MQAALPDVARLQPTPDSLNVILRNTHFKDDILAAKSAIHFRIDHTTKIPVMVFKFPSPYYDFIQILSFPILTDTNLEWLNKNPAVIKLIMSDTVITDRLSTRLFFLTPDESEQLRDTLNELKTQSLFQIHELENHIYSNVNAFLR